MKAVLEFGVRGGYHTDNVILPNAKLAQQIALNIARSYGGPDTLTLSDFRVGVKCSRASWSSSTHFVSVSALDGVMRGPASSTLWKKEG